MPAPTAKKVRTHLKEWQEKTFGGSQNPEVADTVDICAGLRDNSGENSQGYSLKPQSKI